jgi:ABC-type nitrate/sulfonate/bicarbonate transport system substrate-binding protein
MALTELRIGGVPEHFNLPWHLAIENKLFEKNNLRVVWNEYPGGTGAMCADLKNGKLDLAIVLTEGIVADIVKGNPSRILQWYVTSPLVWGIHVPAHSDCQKIEEVKTKRYAISRFGSGSHLMAYVDAQQRGWELSEEQFVLVQNLDGAREAFKENEAEIFMWEKFTTQPLVDAGEFRRIDECPTPWPCFAITASADAMEKHKDAILTVQKLIMESCKALKEDEQACSIIANRYGLQKKNVNQWFAATRWATDSIIDKASLNQVANTLYDLKLIDRKPLATELCSDWSELK